MDIGKPRRVHIVEPLEHPVPGKQPAPPLPRREPKRAPAPERVPEKPGAK